MPTPTSPAVACPPSPDTCSAPPARVLHLKYWYQYEVRPSRATYDGLERVSFPTKPSSLGWRSILEHPEGPQLHAAWHLLVCLTARLPRPLRGYLVSESGHPYTVANLATLTGFPVAFLQRALDFFTSSECAWLHHRPSEKVDAALAEIAAFRDTEDERQRAAYQRQVEIRKLARANPFFRVLARESLLNERLNQAHAERRTLEKRYPQLAARPESRLASAAPPKPPSDLRPANSEPRSDPTPAAPSSDLSSPNSDLRVSSPSAPEPLQPSANSTLLAWRALMIAESADPEVQRYYETIPWFDLSTQVRDYITARLAQSRRSPVEPPAAR